MQTSRKIFPFFSCLLCLFLYFLVQGCTEPQGPPLPFHYTRVPAVVNFQGIVGTTASGKRSITLRWEYDTSNANIRSWDVARNINDTTASSYVPLEIVRLPSFGFPRYVDSTNSIQNITTDSINCYYRVIPNGMDNFVGQTSNILHVVLR